MKTFLSAFVLILVWLLSACSEQPETKKAASPAEPVTGLTALYRMYQVARTWAPDARILQMNALHVTEVKEVPGKTGAWQATFVSDSKVAARTYTYSVVETEPDLHLGVFAGHEESWSGPRGDTKPFLIAGVKVDTDAAYKTALAQAGEAAKRNQNQPISFLLEKLDKFTNASWRVIWGESLGTSGLSLYIDAATGAYLETMH